MHLIDERHWLRWSTLWGRVLGDDGTRRSIRREVGLGTVRAVLTLKAENP
jgi:hypothetical protein